MFLCGHHHALTFYCAETTVHNRFGLILVRTHVLVYAGVSVGDGPLSLCCLCVTMTAHSKNFRTESSVVGA
jgi:hypothetical protein